MRASGAGWRAGKKIKLLVTLRTIWNINYYLGKPRRFHITSTSVAFVGTPGSHVGPSSLGLIGGLGPEIETLDLTSAGACND